MTEFPLKTIVLESKAISRVPAPKWRNRLDIYLNRNDNESARLAATLSLDKLGWTTNVKRACGQISEVWVMELPDERHPQVLGAA